jgi:hypothetical protein
MGLAGLLAVWQIHIASNVPTLVVRGLIATLYRKDVAAGSFVLSDLSIVEGTLTIGFALGFAFFALALMSTALGALGQSRDLETSLSLSLLPTQGLLLWMSGLWFAGAAISISYLDFPRRKLLFRIASSRPRAIYIDSRRQRDELLLFLRICQLEEVMLRVGLRPSIGTPGHRNIDSPHDHGNGATE